MGTDTEALSTETESKQSRPNLRSIGASPRPYRVEALQSLHAHAECFAPLLTHTRKIEEIDEASAIASQYRNGVGKMIVRP